MNQRAQKIATLRARLQELEAAEKATEARMRAAASKRARADDTRRKILIGAFVLDRRPPAEAAELQLRGVSFGAWLTRTEERALFGLAPLAEGAAVAAQAATQPQLSPMES